MITEVSRHLKALGPYGQVRSLTERPSAMAGPLNVRVIFVDQFNIHSTSDQQAKFSVFTVLQKKPETTPCLSVAREPTLFEHKQVRNEYTWTGSKKSDQM